MWQNIYVSWGFLVQSGDCCQVQWEVLFFVWNIKRRKKSPSWYRLWFQITVAQHRPSDDWHWISEQAFLGIFLRTWWAGLWCGLVVCRRCCWRKMDKPAAPQETGGNIFPISFFVLMPLPSASLFCFLQSCFSFPTVVAVLSEDAETPWGRRGAIAELLLAVLVEHLLASKSMQPACGGELHLSCLVNSKVIRKWTALSSCWKHKPFQMKGSCIPFDNLGNWLISSPTPPLTLLMSNLWNSWYTTRTKKILRI